MAEGKKNRKIGRNKKKPAQIRYTNDRRWVKNKAKKIAKYVKNHKWNPGNIKEEVLVYLRNKYKIDLFDK